jgi:putative SOS response-associated peptidase YedK
MCGRFTIFSEKKEIEERFQLKIEIPISKRYNIAPSQQILAITQEDEERKANLFRWGLIPFWSKDPSIGNKLINARAETLDEKPSFKHLIKRKRCLIVSDGFYEWKKEEGKKQPYFIQMKSRKAFALAGLWDAWRDKDDCVYTCTIITTVPNDLMKPLHSRMPVILDEEQEKIWLDSNITDSTYLKTLLTPYSNQSMNAFPVSTMVNNPKNDSIENISIDSQD